ncbi:hypothetical protein RBH26_13845 [Natronolimnohabitans sp. A-GB9]|uniref:HTH domain-containing protein n=1 Tax=Natronolimnohabitans sp. A-GB9 TaxID=3069757 RepID=UPI0027B72076|nr:HTH domain-containing protein [Natronolimnohabitans sp. A-GB9]MDQ2051560.1 hypothetical protein [Natronolimnohabitans sp. A-GB9]
MHSDNATLGEAPAVDLESETSLRIDCYVRSDVPPTVTKTVNSVVERLQRLSDRDRIETYRVTHWPSECPAIEEATDDEPTRDDLVTAFEHWAARNGHSLEPAFRRREVPATSFGVETDQNERVRVPVIALAVSAADGDECAPETDAESTSLQGVVPYTERTEPGRSRTYTVDEWLSIVESDGPGATARTSQHDGPTALEGHQ